MRSKGAALALTLPGVGNRLLAAGTYATGDQALHQQRTGTIEVKTAKCGIFRAAARARVVRLALSKAEGADRDGEAA